jgi:predicted dehydrogenase
MSTSEPFRWGIIGLGGIAEKLAAQLPDSRTAALVAVGSRSIEKAHRFTDRHGGRPYGAYDAVLSDPDVDAVYIALPNGLHHTWTVRALDGGKHVLCEKPLAANAVEAEDMFAAAERSERLLVEAFMYRTLPRVEKAIELANNGALGELRLIQSNFCFARTPSRQDARYHPEQAGGALMDVGCYPVSFARALTAAEPTTMHAIAHIHELGVDDYAVGTLRFGPNVLATFLCGMTVHTEWTTTVAGTEGHLTIENPWLGKGPISVVRGDNREEIIPPGSPGPYATQLDRFADAVRTGCPPPISREDSLGNMRVLDDLRRQIGIPV